ncbi:hypothetical protein NC653_011671 [Populus alba x Populus x berolinensis]|uniref:Uncharacterized protein n=1 Tax=Populus alba x Populus x berolinensis TaxID=444605 RepID=A0AAD6W6V0_9ROSI|nr:hypothetical protein NC653_011671 [Populus alba x Populus x berolinensis]
MAACCCPLIMGILCFQQRKGSRRKQRGAGGDKVNKIQMLMYNDSRGTGALFLTLFRLQANTQADTSASQAVVYLLCDHIHVYASLPWYTWGIHWLEQVGEGTAQRPEEDFAKLPPDGK